VGTVLEQNARYDGCPRTMGGRGCNSGRCGSPGLGGFVPDRARNGAPLVGRPGGRRADDEPTPPLDGYRDALVGGLLLQAGLRGRPTAGWFLASAGADAADVVGGLANLHGMTERQRSRGLGGGVVGIVVGVLGGIAAARTRRT